MKFTHESFLLVLGDACSQGQADSRGAARDENHFLVHGLEEYVSLVF